MASLPRRRLLIAAGALTLAACRPQMASIKTSHTPPFDLERINRQVRDIAAQARPGVVGVGLKNLDSGEVFTLAADRRFPMQSVFKAALGAVVLAQTDTRRLALDELFTLESTDLSPPHSPIAEAWPARRDYTAGELLAAAIGQSDNTAADVLMARIGGPRALTAWLASKQVEDIRVDRYERELQPEMLGLAPFRPAWRGGAFKAALNAVPPDQQRQALAAYLADPRDTATPRGMLDFLNLLNDGQLISPASTQLLLQLMAASPKGAQRIAAGLPPGSVWAHKAGTGWTVQGLASVVNDAGIATLPDKRRYAMAVFVCGTPLEPEACDAMIADIARALVHGVG